ncbi:hypothetical protein AB0B15_14285 [Streptomyces sp. NPDC045456]|uniref:hypothetical protein n=1 Tax=Streptomyces sp. NPDC045456 TaxID=3155254 RepID=UPI0033D4B2FC
MSATQQQEIQHHWIMSIQSGDGRMTTDDGSIGVIPGVHTHTQTFNTVRDLLLDKYAFPAAIVVFFSVTPDQL